MPIVLLRIDERLIHGQVVVGWGNHLHPDRIVVVDDDLAAASWEQELYGLGVPPNLVIAFETVTTARELLPAWRTDRARTIVLTRDVQTMRRLAEDGMLAGSDVNLGGIHYAPGRAEILPYVYLDADERAELQRLSDAGVKLSARDLPGARAVDLERLLRERSA
jgi:mannose/fructose/N-acetylgalactosamine-specific phosphotransferase system component IIB